MALSDLSARLTEQFERLNPRERIVVSVGGAVAAIIGLFGLFTGRGSRSL